jgi:hypothetical protein
MRDHHLGNPKTAKSRRTVTISSTVAEVLARRTKGKTADDFVFTTRTGLPLHNGDVYTHVWRKLIKASAAEGIAPFRFHDLRHTQVAWLVAGGAPPPHIQARLGHESITTTIDTDGHLLPAGDELISAIIGTALSGGSIRPNTAVSTCCWCAARRDGDRRTLRSLGDYRRCIGGGMTQVCRRDRHRLQAVAPARERPPSHRRPPQKTPGCEAKPVGLRRFAM